MCRFFKLNIFFNFNVHLYIFEAYILRSFLSTFFGNTAYIHQTINTWIAAPQNLPSTNSMICRIIRQNSTKFDSIWQNSTSLDQHSWIIWQNSTKSDEMPPESLSNSDKMSPLRVFVKIWDLSLPSLPTGRY